MCNYLKNMEGYKLKDLKSKETRKESRRRDGPRDYKEKKLENDKETAKLKHFIEVIPNEEEVAIDVIPLDVKSPKIFDLKIYKEGKKSYYQIIRVDGKSQMYMVFSHMLKHFDWEDLEDLYKLIYMLVEKKYPLTPPTLSMMLAKKLEIDYQSEMAYQLLKSITKQLKNAARELQGKYAKWVLDLEQTTSLKRRVKKLEKKIRSRTHKLKRLYKVGLTARVESSDNEESLEQEGADEMEVVEEVVEVVSAVKQIIDAAKVSAAGDIVSTASAATTVSAATTTTATTVNDITLAQDKGKGILIEPVKPIKKIDQIRSDKETALMLQAEFDEEERLTREKAEKEKEANIMFDKAFKRVNTFEDFRTELVEGKENRAGTELAQEIPKKQKADLVDLYKLVKAKYELTRSVEDLDLILWGDLKTMFEPHVEDKVWRNQQDYKVLSWKLYDSCGVHSLRMQHVQIYMLVEKKYPLTPSTLLMMLEKKLMIDYESEMAYQLLKSIIKQLKK
ncbi:hypothetical protein Tco_1492873 [Tanacetum coccineum]